MLTIHRSERADYLADALACLLADPLADAMAIEIVSVPTRGVERWLSQRLSHRLGAPAGGEAGICANVSFPFPGTLIVEATATACGFDPASDPWRPERCVWQLVDLIDEHRDDPELGPLVAHLVASTPRDRFGIRGGVRRFATARHIADLFDQYAVHRPDMLISWLGDLPAGRLDDPTPRWQAYLWRLLRDSLVVPSLAERFGVAAARLRSEPDLLDLPERISLFGLTRLPASHVQILEAMATEREVHLFLLHPSATLWGSVAAKMPPPPAALAGRTGPLSPPAALAGRTGPLSPPAALARSADPTSRLASNPLLRSWGRDAREMQVVLVGHGLTRSIHYPVPEPSPPRLLERIQADVRADRSPPGLAASNAGDTRPLLEPGDRSLQVHSCHGRTRQVEVLRDAILHLLVADETLEPRDVIVMCPNIETFAPLIHAAFGGDDPAELAGEVSELPDDSAPPSNKGAFQQDPPDPGLPRLRVRLADRSLRQTNPLLALAAQLLELAGSRLTAAEVVDLAARPPVARRFRFGHEDLSALKEWVVGTGIRWGLDGPHRKPWGLDGIPVNTWRSGLDRLLLGITMAEEGGQVFGGTVPYADVPSSSGDIAGRLTEFVNRLGLALDRLSVLQPAGAWVDALVEGVNMLAGTTPSDEWQQEQLRRVLGDVREEVSAAGASPVLSLAEVRSLLEVRLRGRPTRANFRTGDLTICTLVPMRSIPHRVVALLGLDDGTFPRHPELDGDDLLLAVPRVGDRDPRSEDRQLLLDALLAATDHLLIAYSGRDERTNRPRPPAVPVAELLDVIDATVRLPNGRPARQAITVDHPLQPFDARNFRPGDLVPGYPWSFDGVHLAGSRAAAAARPAPDWLPSPLPPLDEPVIELDHLVSFVEHPVRTFLRRRLGLYLGGRSDQLAAAIPLELNPLEKWGVGDRILHDRLSGIALDRAVTLEAARGLLPPGALAHSVLDAVCSDVEGLLTAVAAMNLDPGPADSVDVHVELPDGRRIVGSVPNVRGSTLLTCIYSRLAAKHRLAAWVRLLAVAAAYPERSVCSLAIGRGQGRQPPAVVRTDPPAGPRPEAALSAIVDLYDEGLREPLPLICDTSAAWFDAVSRTLSEDEALRRAAAEWDDNDRFPGEVSDPEHVYVWGRTPLEDLLRNPRFAPLAERLWAPILAQEKWIAVA
jgi:exodeoxyribonuclease V gamma subunit